MLTYRGFGQVRDAEAESTTAGARCEYSSAVSALRKNADEATLEISMTLEDASSKLERSEFVTKTTSELNWGGAVCHPNAIIP